MVRELMRGKEIQIGFVKRGVSGLSEKSAERQHEVSS